MTMNPTAREAIDRVFYDHRCALHTCFPAQVRAYDLDAQTVDVRPALQREVPSDDPETAWGFESLPDLLGVQVMWPRAGGFVLTFPIAVGDWVMVLCAEQSTLRWRGMGKAPVHPGMSDPFGLNGAVAVPGWFPDTRKLDNVSATDLVLGDLGSDATVRIKPSGEVVIGGASGADYVALAAKVDAELSKIAKSFTTFVGGSGGANFPPASIYATPTSVAAKKVKAR